MNARFPLLVELLLSNARIAGVVDLQDERRRLVDLLNAGDPMLELTNVQVFMGKENEKRFDTLSVVKSSVLAAIPRETDEHNRMRAMQRSMVGRSSTSQGRMAIIMPPMHVEGVAHGPGGATRLKADPSIFAHFFSVTDADLSSPYGELHQMPVVLVNRETIVGMSMLAEVFKAGDPRSHSSPLERSRLDELVSNLEPAAAPPPAPPAPTAVPPNRSFYYPPPITKRKASPRPSE